MNLDRSDGARPWRFEYESPVIRFERHAASTLGDELERQGIERALLVTGRTVGATAAVMDPVREGLGDRLAEVFAETTPEKRLSTAVAGAERFEAIDADAIVALGSGSSLDVATVVRTLALDDRSADEVGREFEETRTLSIPDDRPPMVVVPTTLAGADVSSAAGITAHPDGGLVDSPIESGVSGRGLMPTAAVYDPDLFATTPDDVLAASAMNGFDKGIETQYSRNATPVTDAVGREGLELLAEHLPRMGENGSDPEVLAPVVEGIILVQYGLSRPGAQTLSIIHAFGHGLSHGTPLHQGVSHGIVAPDVLRTIFEKVHGRRNRLAASLGVDDEGDPAEAVPAAVADIRDALGLPDRLRDVDGPSRDEFDAVAERILADPIAANGPPDLELSVEEVREILEDAW